MSGVKDNGGRCDHEKREGGRADCKVENARSGKKKRL